MREPPHILINGGPFAELLPQQDFLIDQVQYGFTVEGCRIEIEAQVLHTDAFALLPSSAQFSEHRGGRRPRTHFVADGGVR